jgi:hypothetical protein
MGRSGRGASNTGAGPSWNRTTAVAFHEAYNDVDLDRGSGTQIEMHGSEIWTFRDGQVAGIALYRTREEALKAAGLE